ncbi:Fibrillin-1 [Schistosoma japonicum]|nr:Fibrillin-1 [Schistosoma japonicum]KAH8853281.1 Fibrillin-1 [Schistosoma japonicum]
MFDVTIKSKHYLATIHKMSVYVNLNVILLLVLVSFDLLPNSLLLLCSDVPKSTKLKVSQNTLNQFKLCCNDGLIAAHSLDLPILSSQSNGPSNETCAEILQFGTSVVEDDNERLSSDHFWCERVQHLCCLSARRLKACRIGSDHIVKYNAKNCSSGEFTNLIDKRLTPIARECCLCQLIWSKSLQNKTDKKESVQSVCPDGNCCNLLNQMLIDGNSTSLPKSTMIMSDDPNVNQAITDYLTTIKGEEQLVTTTLIPVTQEKSVATTIKSTTSKAQLEDQEDDFSFNLVGGIDLPDIWEEIDADKASTTKETVDNYVSDIVTSTIPSVSLPSTIDTSTIVHTSTFPALMSTETTTATTTPTTTTDATTSTTTIHPTTPTDNASDKTTTTGLKVTSHFQTIQCQENFVWDNDQQLCVRMVFSCPIGMYLNKKTKKCVLESTEKSDCPTGYRLSNTRDECEDINECIEGLSSGRSACEGEGMTCENQPGSYNCSCNSGFSLASDGTCVDINECTSSYNPCAVGQQCRNLIGSYQCLREVPCGYGYVLNPRTQQCEDVDECKIDPLICGKGMACINVRGGHKCVDYHCPGNAKRNKVGDCVPCPTGYVYNVSSGICDDIDECQQPNKCRSWEKCVNERGFFLCEAKLNCQHGTRINSNGTECIDIDECLEKSFHCDDGKICVNTLGSYYCIESNCSTTQIYDYEEKRCTCEKGYRLDENECIDIDECYENKHNCTYDSTCMNYIGGYRCIRVEECPSGLKRKYPLSRCEDINECELRTDNCGAHAFCKNTVGSYQCICKHGYKNVNETDCVDIDECTIFTPAESCPDSKARCVNTQGSYICVCPEGFVWIGYPDLKCKDVNECAEKPNICGKEHQCINIIGSYRCQCAPGYKTGDNDKSCIDIDECNVKPYNNDINFMSPCPYSLCINQPGSYQCQCPDGFRLGRGNRCYDIDECHELENVCKSNNPHAPSQACINLMGSYRCVSDETPPNYVKHRLGNGFRYELKDATKCSNTRDKCIQRMDDLFIELDQDARVPQTLARVDTKGLPTGVVRIDLSKHYAYQAYSGKQIPVSTAFRLQPSRSHTGSVEVRLLRKLPAPMNILISVHVTISKDDVEIAHAITKLYLFVTQSFSERLRTSRIIQRGII